MKPEQKKQVRHLRQTTSLSLKEISAITGVSKGSVSLWVRDIVLSDEQKFALLQKNPAFNRQFLGQKRMREKFYEKRKQYQESGRQMLHNLPLEQQRILIGGCMLYWAEGAKSRNQLKFSNSDPNMLKYFVCFLKSIFSVKDDDIAVYINCHTDINDLQTIESFWLSELSLPSTCLRKATVNCYSVFSKRKKINKLKYGTVSISVSDQSILQKIYGVIQEFSGFDNSKWIT